MKDYSECLLNVRFFLRNAEECFLTKNPMGAYHHVMNAFQETEELLEIALEESKQND